MRRMQSISTETLTVTLKVIERLSLRLEAECMMLASGVFTRRTTGQARVLSRSIRTLEGALERMKDFSIRGSVCILALGLGTMLFTPSSYATGPSTIDSDIALSISTDPTDYYLRLWLGFLNQRSPKCAFVARYNSRPHFPSCNCFYKSTIRWFFRSQRIKMDQPPYHG